MRRDDLLLVAVLAVAFLVIFSEQIARALSMVRELEASRGLQLLPALVLLTTVFSLHLIWKGRQAKVQVVAATKAAQLADERATELAKLVDFSKALTEAPDSESVRLTAASHLPLLAPGRNLWAMTRTRGQWEPLVTAGRVPPDLRERAARLALGDALGDEAEPAADICFPLVVSGAPLGVVGVSAEGGMSDDQRSVLAAAAALLAASLKNAELFREIRENSVRDSLTGCFTRAHALEVLEVELRRARRTQMPLSILMMDLDNFSAINDRYGRLCGDTILATVGQRLKRALRGSDVKCRYDGEEFLIILTDTPMGGALRVSETLRREIGEDYVSWNGERVGVTASFGVATIRAGEVDPAAALARAQDALVRAKREGRNRVYDNEYVAVPA